ncbi:gamma-glutamyltransferase [Paraburkholderia sp. BL10I2N1]|uniref:gamma-glutamyltransferase n=1 Tax=Paraburkholderia sp. BL10I2N1 TaxID=1938796 RepID=UPI0010620FC3|nr:gamma-glutamyltransferase [Paraburkholderia sp. BL10I2N1]
MRAPAHVNACTTRTKLPRAAQPQGSDTTFICVADSEGNAVGHVQRLNFDFGAAVLDPQSGVLLRRPFNRRGVTCPPRSHRRRLQDRTRGRRSNSST